tara:strand:+ start:874 stop:1473 length:600 start_codon:yes stop_codon:yes gene_type:complete
MISVAELLLREPANCAGFFLSPLTLGHYLMLEAFECPFASHSWGEETGDKAFDSFIFALTVCRKPYEDLQPWLDGFEKELQTTMASVAKNGGLVECSAMFQAWFFRHTEIPETKGTSQAIPGARVGSDFALRILGSARRVLGIDHKEVLRTSYALLLRAHIQDLEERGLCEVVSEERKAQIEAAKQRTEEEAANDGKEG